MSDATELRDRVAETIARVRQLIREGDWTVDTAPTANAIMRAIADLSAAFAFTEQELEAVLRRAQGVPPTTKGE